MNTRARVLVLGSGGWLGHAVQQALAARRLTTAAPSHDELDVRDAQAVESAIEALEPTVCLNLAAARPSADDDVLHGVNVVGAGNVAAVCARHGMRLVHVSTDAVLDGRSAPYDDDAAANPLTSYGRSKAAGEEAVLRAWPDALCVRTSLIWDPASMDRGTASFARRLATDEPCPLFTDEVRCPLPRDALAAALLDLADLEVRGTLNVAGREAMSRHDFGQALLEHFAVPGAERIQPVRQADRERDGATPRPRDLRLRVERVEHLLARRMPGVREVLRPPTTPRGETSH